MGLATTPSNDMAAALAATRRVLAGEDVDPQKDDLDTALAVTRASLMGVEQPPAPPPEQPTSYPSTPAPAAPSRYPTTPEQGRALPSAVIPGSGGPLYPPATGPDPNRGLGAEFMTGLGKGVAEGFPSMARGMAGLVGLPTKRPEERPYQMQMSPDRGITARKIAGAAGQGLPSLMLALGFGGGAAGLVGKAAGFAAGSGIPVATQTFEESYAETGDAGKARAEAGVNTAITLATSWLPGMALLQKIPGGSEISRRVMGKVVGRLTTAALAEGGQEALEEVGNAFTEELIRRDKSLTPALVKRLLTDPEYLARYVTAGGAGTLLGGAARLPGEAADVARRVAERPIKTTPETVAAAPSVMQAPAEGYPAQPPKPPTTPPEASVAIEPPPVPPPAPAAEPAPAKPQEPRPTKIDLRGKSFEDIEAEIKASPEAQAEINRRVEEIVSGPTATAPEGTSVLDIAMKRLTEAGWDPKWPFIMADLGNARFRRAIEKDPAVSADEKARILSFAPGGEGYNRVMGVEAAAPQTDLKPKEPTDAVSQRQTERSDGGVQEQPQVDEGQVPAPEGPQRVPQRGEEVGPVPEEPEVLTKLPAGLNPDDEITVETEEETVTMTVEEAVERLDALDEAVSAEEGGADEGALVGAERKAIIAAMWKLKGQPAPTGKPKPDVLSKVIQDRYGWFRLSDEAGTRWSDEKYQTQAKAEAALKAQSPADAETGKIQVPKEAAHVEPVADTGPRPVPAGRSEKVPPAGTEPEAQVRNQQEVPAVGTKVTYQGQEWTVDEVRKGGILQLIAADGRTVKTVSARRLAADQPKTPSPPPAEEPTSVPEPEPEGGVFGVTFRPAPSRKADAARRLKALRRIVETNQREFSESARGRFNVVSIQSLLEDAAEFERRTGAGYPRTMDAARDLAAWWDKLTPGHRKVLKDNYSTWEQDDIIRFAQGATTGETLVDDIIAVDPDNPADAKKLIDAWRKKVGKLEEANAAARAEWEKKPYPERGAHFKPPHTVPQPSELAAEKLARALRQQREIPTGIKGVRVYAAANQDAAARKRLDAIVEEMGDIKPLPTPRPIKATRAVWRQGAIRIPDPKTPGRFKDAAAVVKFAQSTLRDSMPPLKFSATVRKDNILAWTDGRSMYEAVGVVERTPGVYTWTGTGLEAKPEPADSDTFKPIPEIPTAGTDRGTHEIAQMWRRVKMANIVTDEERHGVAVAINKDGSFGFAAASPTAGAAEVNLQPGAKTVGAVDSHRMAQALEFLGKQGGTTVTISTHQREHAAIMWDLRDGRGNRVILMGLDANVVPAEEIRELAANVPREWMHESQETQETRAAESKAKQDEAAKEQETAQRKNVAAQLYEQLRDYPKQNYAETLRHLRRDEWEALFEHLGDMAGVKDVPVEATDAIEIENEVRLALESTNAHDFIEFVRRTITPAEKGQEQAALDKRLMGREPEAAVLYRAREQGHRTDFEGMWTRDYIGRLIQGKIDAYVEMITPMPSQGYATAFEDEGNSPQLMEDVAKKFESRGQGAAAKLIREQKGRKSGGSSGVAYSRPLPGETPGPEVAGKPGGRPPDPPGTPAPGAENAPVRGMPVPEMVALAKALLGKVPLVRRMMGARGKFKHAEGVKHGSIVIDPSVAEDPNQLAKTLAHEIGHLIDWLPHYTLKRGNMLGHLAALRRFLKGHLSLTGAEPLKPKDYERLRKAARDLLSKTAEIEIDEEIEKISGLTPEDVLAIWNSTADVQKINPQLWRYVASLSAAEKKDIVREAMRGMVPERLKQFASVVREKTGRKIKKTIEFAGTEAELEREYRRLLHEELRKRQAFSNSEVRRELKALSKWWRPWDERWASAADKAYRNSSSELYADFLSVILNSPGDAEQRAPESYRAFFTFLSRRPEVREAYLKLQDLLAGTPEAIADKRRRDIREAFARGEEIMRARIEEKRARRASIFTEIYLGLIDRGWGVEKAIRRNEPDRAERDRLLLASRGALEDLALRDNPAHVMLSDLQERGVRPMIDAGGTLDDAGEFMLLRRITNERKEIPNPWGHTPATAAEMMKDLRHRLGPERFAKVERAVAVLDDLVFEEAERAVEVGSYNRKTFEETIEPNRGNYATFAVLDHLEDYVPAGVKQQVGTFKEVANPFVSTVLKTISLIRLNELQTAKRAVIVNILAKEFSGEVKKHAWFPDRNEPHPEPGNGIVTILEDGRPNYYETDQYVARAFQIHDIGILARAARALSLVTYKPFHAVFVKYNPGWQIFNLQRDVKRFYKNAVAVQQFGGKAPTVAGIVRAYLKAFAPSVHRARQTPDPLIEEMLAGRELDIPFVQFDHTEEMAAHDRLLERYGLWAEGKPKPLLIRALAGIGDAVERVGVWTETMPKVAGHYVAREAGIDGPARAYFVRNFVGTPNLRRKGLATPLTNSIWMYSNVALQGLRADAAVALHPKSAGGYWFRSFMVDFMPKIAMAGAAAGIFGPAIKALFEMIPEADLANYIVIPLGGSDDDEEKKAIYLRLPHDDSNRVLAVALWKLWEGKPVQAFAAAQGQLPFPFDPSDITPALQIPLAWLEFATGNNPHDRFRHRSIVADEAWKAGGWYAASDMVRWTISQGGVLSTVLHAFRDRPAGDPSEESTVEKVIASVPGLERVIRISNRGVSEAEWDEIAVEEAEAARFRLGLPEAVRAASREHYRLNRLGTDRLTPDDDRRRLILNRWYGQYLRYTKAMKTAIESGDGAREKALRSQLDTSTVNLMNRIEGLAKRK